MEKPTSRNPDLSAGSVRRRLLLVTLLALVAYASVAFFVDVGAVRRALAALPFRNILLALGFSSLSFGLRFLRWQGYLRALSVTLPARASGLIFFSGLALSVTPGKAGELLKSVMLSKLTGADLASTVPLILAERIMDLVALLMLGAIGAIGLSGAGLVVSGALLGATSLLVVLGSPKLSDWVFTRLAQLRPLRSYAAPLAAARSAVARLFVPAQLAQALFYSLGAWVVHGLALYAVANAFPGVVLSFLHAMFANSAPLLAGALAMVPGGLGLTEASMTGALMALGGDGATQAVAVAITLVVRATTLWWAVIIGSAALVAWQW